MVKITSSGSFKNSYKFLRFLFNKGHLRKLDEYGKKGVEALSSATPVDTGKTAASWGYEINEDKDSLSITWTNNNKSADGTPIVILLQYGHGTGWGRYVRGRDFINPALKPVFDEIAEDIWKEVTNA